MNSNQSILSSCTSGGCGAKIGPGELASLLKNIPAISSDKLLVGYDSSDDAAVYQISPTQSIISTVDFFSPMVEDPVMFGEIAAANALSDVYAMGGTPILALNLVCFPEVLPKELLADMLMGGGRKVVEAGAVLAGGHSIYDKEPKYGLAVTGIVDNDRIIRNNTPKVGHKLILTKPLGVGIVMAAARVDQAAEGDVSAAVKTMARLNRYAAEKMAGYNVSACTDITGFGLLAHLGEMCADSVTARLVCTQIPVLSGAVGYAENYMITAAGQRNRNFFGDKIVTDHLTFGMQELLFDPQTSGGLLICVSGNDTQQLLEDIQKQDPMASIIGEILPRSDKAIIVEV